MKRTFLAAFTLLLAITLQAQKRVNNRMYNPDPAPVVSGDRLYVFTGHDLDTATYFRMPDWQLFSTTELAIPTSWSMPQVACLSIGLTRRQRASMARGTTKAVSPTSHLARLPSTAAPSTSRALI